MPRKKQVSFQVSEQDDYLIGCIVDRVVALYHKMGVDAEGDRLDVRMDLTAVHANGCPLDLERLLDARDGDFTHDIGGIRRHLDRTTGKLSGCFDPRHARRVTRSRASGEARAS